MTLLGPTHKSFEEIYRTIEEIGTGDVETVGHRVDGAELIEDPEKTKTDNYGWIRIETRLTRVEYWPGYDKVQVDYRDEVGYRAEKDGSDPASEIFKHLIPERIFD